MSDYAAKIARKIDHLDHPDSELQDEILADLSRQVDRALPVVLANLPIVNARVRRALLRWLMEHLTEEATLPLMRYIFDEEQNIAEQMGRAMAMGLLLRRAKSTDNPSERGRLRAFGEDICTDSNPEVRVFALQILAYIGDGRSIEAVEPLRADEDEGVRKAAYRTLSILEESIPRGDAVTLNADELLLELLRSYGPRQRQWIRHWRRHPERSQIALSVLRRRGELRDQALQILLREPRSEARPYLAAMVLEDPASGLAALSLRLLTKLAAAGEARPDEVEAIRRALRSTSILSRAAACAAIEALELPNFLDELSEHLLSPDLELASAAAKAVRALASEGDQHLLGPLCQAVQLHERRRRDELSREQRVELLATLLGAVEKIVTVRSLSLAEVQRMALTTLERSGHHRSIRLAAVELLLKLTPQGELPDADRWDEASGELLLSVLNPQDLPSAELIATILNRVAPLGLPGLARAAEELWKAGTAEMIAVVIPLLERADSPEGVRVLEQIRKDEDPQIAQAARDALRRYRNKEPLIDVEFIPRKR